MLASLLVPMCLLYVSSYRAADWVSISGGIHERAAQDLFVFIRQHTPADAVIVCAKPRAVSLYTGRAASVSGEPTDSTELLDYMKRIKATYVVTGIIDGSHSRALVGDDSTHFRRVYGNAHFTLFEARVDQRRSGGLAPADRPQYTARS